MKKFVRKSRKSQEKIDWKKQFEILTVIATMYGFEVKLHARASSEINWNAVPNNKPAYISIQTRSYEKMTYDMLHELGHHRLRIDWKKYKTRYPATAFSEIQMFKYGISKYMRRTDAMIDELREEYDAWDEAAKIADKYNITVNKKNFNSLRIKSLTAYVRHYGRRLKD
jgi:hypothetical protein